MVKKIEARTSESKVLTRFLVAVLIRDDLSDDIGLRI